MKMVINGEPTDSVTGNTYSVSNPATGEKIDQVPLGNEQDVNAAVDAAEEAMQKWSQTPPIDRARLLQHVSELVRQNAAELAKTLTMEQGKPLGEATSEINSFANTCEYYAGLAGRVGSRYSPFTTGEGYYIVMKLPVGVVGAILPWNFPISLLGWKVAPGLAAGNTFVVKPASTTPLTELKIARLFYESGLVKGALNIVTGPGSKVGEAILNHPKIDKIAFTGETETGKHVLEAASKDIKRVTLELGGSDPMIVCRDADLELAVEAALWGRYRNCGQSCTSIKRLFLVREIADNFLDRFMSLVKTIRVGNGLDPQTHMGPLHTSGQRRMIEEFVSDAVSRNAEVVFGGSSLSGKEYGNGFFYMPTVLTRVPYDSKISCEECFGPALPVFVVSDEDEAIEHANDTIYGLGSSVWTRDLTKAHKIAERLEAGITWINSPPIARPEVPFGGFKQSGFGRELGLEGLEHYYEIKSVQVDLSGPNKKWKFPV